MLSKSFIVILFLISLPVFAGELAFFIANDINSKSASAALKAHAGNILNTDINDGLIPLSLAPHAEYIKLDFIQPTYEFKNRITKKPYGIFITPQTSPVQPDKFTGFHNAVDIE